MADPSGWTSALVTATALHAGFQLTVTLVVYPALATVPAAAWSPAHDAHSRRVAPLVALVYGAALVTAVGTVLVTPSGGTVTALVGLLTAVGVTAASAAPAHGRLGRGKDDDLMRTLLRADRVRALAAVAALAGALAAAY